MIQLSHILIYLAILSLLAFCMMGLDKWKAKKNRWRISEKTLLLTAALGGSLGGCIGMQVFHHKTRHWYFRYGLPAMVFLHAALLAAFVYWDAFVRH